MEVVTLRLTESLAKEIDKTVRKGLYSSRSEFLREAARALLNMQKGMFTGKTREVDRDKLIKEYAREKGFKL